MYIYIVLDITTFPSTGIVPFLHFHQRYMKMPVSSQPGFLPGWQVNSLAIFFPLEFCLYPKGFDFTCIIHFFFNLIHEVFFFNLPFFIKFSCFLSFLLTIVNTKDVDWNLKLRNSDLKVGSPSSIARHLTSWSLISFLYNKRIGLVGPEHWLWGSDGSTCSCFSFSCVC